jgi:hypothetical protein
VVIAVVFAMVAAPTLMTAFWEIRHGHGAATYANVYGLAIHWTSPLILAIALAATLLLAFVARLIVLWRDKRDTATLISKIAARVASGNDDNVQHRVGRSAPDHCHSRHGFYVFRPAE